MNKFLKEGQTTIRCTYCKQRLQCCKINDNFKILKCSCFQYPEFMGIAYLKRDVIAKKTIEYVKKHNYFHATKSLFGLPNSLFFPISFIIFTKIFRILGFNLTIQILKLFSYDRNWSKYLIKRKSIPYYQISEIFFNDIKVHNPTVLDVGCGTGHLYSAIYKRTLPQKVFGIDQSFFNLLLARLFFATKETSLICCDADRELPFYNYSFDIVHIADTFHYIKRKWKFLNNIGYITKGGGILTIIHNHATNFGNILGTPSNKTVRNLQRSGFCQISTYSDSDILMSLNLSSIVKMYKSDAYSIIASKDSSQKVAYRNVNSFVFISPHLDDVVLSCSQLILYLTNLGKKVIVVTLFTRAQTDTISPQANRLLHGCNYKNSEKLYFDLRSEDKKALEYLGAESMHLGFIDAAWRSVNGKLVYPNEKEQFSGKISSQDSSLVKDLQKIIVDILMDMHDVVVLGPLAIGGHADHVIANRLVNKLNTTKSFWEDFPYNVDEINRHNATSLINKYDLLFKLNNLNFSKKINAIKMYKSQFNYLFDNGVVPNKEEKFYIEKIK